MNSAAKSQRNRSWLTLLAIGMVTIPTVTAYAYGYLIVFDPKNFKENTKQVHALFEQIERESTQIELQEMELAHQTITLATDLHFVAQDLNTQVGTSFADGGLHEHQVQAELERRYPIDPPGHEPGWLQKQRPIWAEIERQRLVQLAALQNHVYRDLGPASERLASIIEASNGKHVTSSDPPGVTAAEQSRNELMAMWSGEMDRIAALRTVRALVRAERVAREQCELAYATARREVLMRDWPPSDRANDR